MKRKRKKKREGYMEQGVWGITDILEQSRHRYMKA